MPRIAILFEYPTLLGGERSLLASLERLRSEFDFIALSPPSGDLAEAITRVGIDAAPSPLFDRHGTRLPRQDAQIRLAETVRALNADLLHANSLAMGRLTGAIASDLQSPCTSHLRDIIGLSKRAIEDLNRNKMLLAVSAATRSFHVGQGLEPARTIVVPTGVDLELFAPRAPNPQIRVSLGIPPTAVVALTVGQIGLRKGWDLLAEVSETIARAAPNIHLLFAGERYSQKAETIEYEAALRRRLHTALPSRVHFLGNRGDMPDLMAASDLLVHPARQEPFGRVLLEASAIGLPIVATDVGGTAELLQDGISARLVPPNNPGHLAAAILEISANASLRSQFAAAARQSVSTRFSADIAAERLAAVWRELL